MKVFQDRNDMLLQLCARYHLLTNRYYSSYRQYRLGLLAPAKAAAELAACEIRRNAILALIQKLDPIDWPLRMNSTVAA